MFSQLVRTGQRLIRLDVQANYKQLWNGSRDQITKQCSSEVIEDLPDVIKTFLAREPTSQPSLGRKKGFPFARNKTRGLLANVSQASSIISLAEPIMLRILNDKEASVGPHNKERLPSCLILVATSELAAQIAEVFEQFSNLGIRSVVLAGNHSGQQLDEMSLNDHDVFIATPTRLVDLVQTEKLDLSNIEYLVLDDADRMLEIEPHIGCVVEKISKKTLIWSANWLKGMQTLREFVNTDQNVAAI